MTSVSIINPEPVRLPGPNLLHHLVSSSGFSGGTAIDALLADGSRVALSYQELHAASDSLAAKIQAQLHIHSSKPTSGYIIPILLRQCPELYISLLAVLKAGGAFCPLNLDAPSERVRFILEDTNAKVLITTKDLKARLPAGLDGVKILVLDDADAAEGTEASLAPRMLQCSYHYDVDTPFAVNEKDLAYIMYTSGSTGTPKGVGVSHQAVTQSLLAHDRHIPRFRRFLQFAAPTFDVSVFEIFFPLYRGSTLVSCNREAMLDDLPAVITDLEVDACELTPTVAGSLLRKRENAPGLRLLLTIGEMLSEPVIREFGGNSERESMLWAMYGPTEAAIHCTLVPAMSWDSSPNEIGIPLDTVSCYVISTEYNPSDAQSFSIVPAGDIGELVVGGYQNATGYINRPEQTAGAFVDSPFGPVYRTGDLARVLEDGTLECLGRMSEGQVKLRGQRIELGEVEHAALRVHGCHGAVAAVINNILVLFCAVDMEESGDSLKSIISEKCSEWLPAFMVPGDIILMGSFPRLASGKVDRKQLKSDYQKSVVEGDSYDDSANPGASALSKQVIEAIFDVIGSRVRLKASLASAGLDSLGSIRLSSRLRKDGISITSIQILKAKTVEDLCNILSTQAGSSSTSREDVDGISGAPTDVRKDLSPLIEKHSILRDIENSIVAVVPCTTLQSSMLVETTYNPKMYCNAVELEFSVSTMAQDIASAFLTVAKANEILRTGFVYHDGEFLQVVLKELQASQVAVVGSFDTTFELADDEGFLQPFRVQIMDSGAIKTRVLVYLHHSIYDGWSFDMILSDVLSLLRGESPSPRPQFSAMVAFLNNIPDQQYEESRRFWGEQLSGWEKTPLPKLSGRLPHVDSPVQSLSVSLNSHKSSVVNHAKELGCSPQAVFQAALLWLWSAIIGSEDVVIGTVTSGRTIDMPEVERVVGPCIASLPLRVNLANVATTGDILKFVHTSNRSMIEHAPLPLSDIKRLTNMTGKQSLYDVLFVYQESLESHVADQNVVRQVSHTDMLETPLLLEVEPCFEGFRAQLTYHSDILEPALARAFLRILDEVVQNLLRSSTMPLSSIRDSFSADLLAVHNPQVQRYAGSQDLAGVVESAAAKTPEKTAVIFARSLSHDQDDREILSFRQLNSLANRIAFWIREIDPEGCNSIVAIIMEKSALFYASLLGILKTGRAYLPVLPSTPFKRISAILEQSRATICVTDNTSHATLKSLQGVKGANVQQAELDKFPDSNPERPIDGSRPAYVIYTSGTTGTPKGVVLTTLNIVSHLDILEKIYPVHITDPRFLQSCSQAFDVSVFEIFFTWKTSMCLCSASNDVLFEDLERAIRVLEVTHLSMTPTVASLVRRSAVPNVQFLVTAGEPMTQAVFREWKGALYQGYGPSETTNICTVKKMADGDHIEHLGFAFDNTSTFVFYPNSLQAAPIGTVGELCFGGDQVAQGYLNEPALTAAKFITHPSFGRLYRSGDLGRMLPDGSLLILGRLDDQIKLRGQRIDVGEISSLLSQTGLVSSSAVLPMSHTPGAPKKLVAFYVNASGAGTSFSVLEPSKEDTERQNVLFSTLEAALPGYMVPSYLIPISVIPMTPSGKIHKAELLAAFQGLQLQLLEAMSPALRNTGDESSTLSSDEACVMKAVSTALKIDHSLVTRWTPLASFGLDSITAISVARALSSALQKRVPISVVLKNPCIAQLTRSLLSGERTQNDPDGPREAVWAPNEEMTHSIVTKFERENLEIESIFPCTALQEAMLSSPLEGVYYNSIVLRLKIPPYKMEEYWKVMCARHEILRTCFVSTEDPDHAFVQVVLKRPQLRWKTSTRLQSTSGECFERLREMVGSPVDTTAPPFALEVIFQDNFPYLCFFCHHAMYDGVAMTTLLREVEDLVHGIDLPPPISSEPFLREALALPSGTDAFWSDHFQGFQPTSFSSPGAKNGPAGTRSHDMRLDLSLSALENRSHTLSLSLLSVFQAVWANTLSIVTGVEDVCFGSVMNGRSVPIDDADRLVAPCFNTIPLRVDLSVHNHASSLFRHLQRANPEVMKYQFTPLRRIQKLLSQPHGLFNTLLLLQPPRQCLDMNVWELVLDSGGMDVPLVCEIIPDSATDCVDITLYYDGSHYTTPFITALGDALNHLTCFLTQFPSSALRQLQDLPVHTRNSLQSVNIKRPTTTSSRSTTPESEGELWSDAELRVRGALATLSSVGEKAIGKKTTIFQLGLDSINAVQLASLLRRRGLNVTATDVLNHPTCEALALSLRHKYGDDTTVPDYFDVPLFQQKVTHLVSSPGRVFESVLPCTPMQAAMITEFVQSRAHDYFNYLHLELEEGLPLSDVFAAWEIVIRAHPILRVGFVSIDSPDYPDIPYAMVKYSRHDVPISVSILQPGTKLNVAKWKLDMAQQVLDTLHEPPWRVALLEKGGQVSMHIAIHHALYDAHSIQLIFEDLARCINGGRTREAIPVEKTVSTLLGLVLRDSLEKSETFWKTFSGNAVVNSFPVMTPLRVERGHLQTHCCESSLSFKDITHACQTANISIQAALQAAWTRVLSSYLGEELVIFGTVMAGRVTEPMQNAVFPCITTMPVIAKNNKSNRALLDSMMALNKDLHQHQFSRLPDVQRWIGLPGRALFDTLLVYQRGPLKAKPLPWTVKQDKGVVNYPVSIEVECQEHSAVSFRITFRTEVLPQEQASIVLRQLDAALRHLILEPEGDEDDLWPSVPQLASVSPASSAKLPSEATLVHQLVEAQALRQPDKVALEFVSEFDGEKTVSQRWTFSEFDIIGNKVAALLVRDISPGSIVAIHFDKCPEAYFSILGILKAGCAFLAIDPSAPRARREFILNDSKAVALLVRSRAELDVDPTIPVIEIQEHSLPDDPEPAGVQIISPQVTCYCLYTSGTTGEPKGCEITHENTVQALMAFQSLFRGHWDDDSRWLQFASLHFDVSVLEQYWSWSVGMTVVSASKDLILDDLEGTIRRLRITHIDLTPSLASLVRPEMVPSLWRGVFITGGEQLKQEILDAWGPKGVIYNAYGPTEATIGVTMRQQVPANGRPVNIGRQFPNVGTYVFRQGTEILVPKGGVGELCVSGKLVGKGYLNRPQLTEERFPTLKAFGERVYRTGDLVRLLHDGSFDFLGRADDQVKLRGQRLQLGEIDHAIRSGASNIQDVATIVTKSSKTGKDMLVSFVVPQRKGGPEHPTSLSVLDGEECLVVCDNAKDACKARLPGYMVPTYIVALPYIPLSRNNKAEVKELRAFFSGLSAQALSRLSSSTTRAKHSLSKSGAVILESLKEFDSQADGAIDADATIFDFGVDSISVPRLARLLKNRGFSNASAQLILRHPAIGDLARALEDAPILSSKNKIAEAKQLMRACDHRWRGFVCGELGVRREDIEYIAPCTPLQQGIISRALTVGAINRSTYFNTFQLSIAKETSIEKLKEAWERTIESHAILRTSFIVTPDGFVQVASRTSKVQWINTSLPVEEFQVEQHRWRREWVEANSPHIIRPLEFILNQTADSVLLNIHIFHGLYDGNSFVAILNFVSAIYYDVTPIAGPAFLDLLPLGPLWKHDSSRDFWAQHLKGWSPAKLPSHITSHDGADILIHRSINAARLDEARKSLGVTFQSLVLAFWAASLQGYLNRSITIGIIVSGRAIEAEGVENAVGPLFNTLPFFSRYASDTKWPSLIRECNNYNASVSAFQHVALRDIQKWCSNGNHLFDNLFAFQVERIPNNTGYSDLWTLRDEPPTADYPLAFEATLRDRVLNLSIVASANTFDNNQAAQLMEIFVDNVERFLANQEASVFDEKNSVPNAVVYDAITVSKSDMPTAGRANVSLSEREDLCHESRLLLQELSDTCETPVDELFDNLSLQNLGLDSIDVVKLAAKLKSRGINVSTTDIIKCATITDMVELVQALRVTPADSVNDVSKAYEQVKAKLRQSAQLNNMSEDDVEQFLPPTPLQEAMMSQMLLSDCHQYFNHDLLEIGKETDIGRLKDAWAAVYHASSILRTIFVEVADSKIDFSYTQAVLRPAANPPIELVELENLDQVRDLISRTKAEAASSQGRGNLFRLHFMTIGSRNFMLLSIAHALYDGWSLGLLHSNVEAAYHGENLACPSPEPYLQILVSSSAHNEGFWKQYLVDATPTVLMPSRPQMHALDDHALHRAEAISNSRTRTVVEFGKKHGISLQVIGQACWAAVLSSMASSLDLTFGVVLSGRDFEGAENVLFPTMNTVAVRCILHGTVVQFLHYMEENMASIKQHQSYPLRKALLAAKGIASPLFNTLFLFQKSPLEPKSVPSQEPLMKSIESSSSVEYPICVELEAVGEDLTWRTACEDAYLDDSDTGMLLYQLDRALQYILESPEKELLSFEHPQVSVCGLASFQLKEELGDDTSYINGTTNGVEEVSWTPTEEKIREVLCRVSGSSSEEVPKSSTLYNLGLDSITAIKASANLRRSGVHLSVRQLLMASSIAHMAELADATPKLSASAAPIYGLEVREDDSLSLTDEQYSALQISPADVECVLPILPMQVYMLSTWQNSSGSIFFPTFDYRLSGLESQKALEVAWTTLVAEIPLLRTVFVATTEPARPLVQVILKQTSRTALRRAHITWDVGSGSRDGQIADNDLVQLRVQKADNDSWLLKLRIHHALYDAISLPDILGRLAVLCSKHTVETLSLNHWKEFTALHLSVGSVEKRRRFWTRYLGTADTPASQVDWPETCEKTTKFVPSAISDVTTIRSLCARNSISLQALFLAAYALVVSSQKACNEGDKTVVFGTYLANRALLETLPESFPTLNLVPLKVVIKDGEDVASVATRIQSDIHEITEAPNSTVGLWEIAEWSGLTIDSFVNFISSSAQDGAKIQEGAVTFEPLNHAYPSVTGHSDLSFEVPGWLKINPVAKLFPAAIDIEAIVAGNGLDIGIFAPSFRLSDVGAREMMGDLISILNGVLEKAS
ncbi:hypothetical protein jhhlp_003062 [Lomentospora prolificans]|uniref:Carrier domain-containing protein n=1 Tax=Lomentospora prolificans TaxID=41688 RepID=A0A2N3NFT1_9PEZI|nr:hypothetical protein jhhlp_003062 [Lomentospora prolificans]